jgi:hypothetical protein
MKGYDNRLSCSTPERVLATPVPEIPVRGQVTSTPTEHYSRELLQAAARQDTRGDNEYGAEDDLFAVRVALELVMERE